LVLIERLELASKPLLERIGQLRISAWSTNKTISGFIPTDNCWTDKHDIDSIHWIASVGDRLVASSRLTVRECLADLPDGSFYDGFEKLIAGGAVASLNRLVVAEEVRHHGLADIFDAVRIGEVISLGISTIVALVDLPFRLHNLTTLGFEVVGESHQRALRDAPTLVLVWHLPKANLQADSDRVRNNRLAPLESDTNIRLTSNETGWCSQIPSRLNKEFIRYAAGAVGAVLDIGGGIGVASIEALRQGSKEVVLNDVEPKHLQIFGQRAMVEQLLKFKLALGQFPNEIDFDENTFSAIHASNILHFLTPAQLLEALHKLARWLTPEGRAFFQVSSPYVGNFRDFIPIYEKRKSERLEWPGLMEDCHVYASADTSLHLPKYLHLMTKDDLILILDRAGFKIESAYEYRRDGLPAALCCDGRENVAVVASKR
jgi:SAM-dependent methyltransferase